MAKTLRALGLRGIGQRVVHLNRPTERGAIKKVAHLVSSHFVWDGAVDGLAQPSGVLPRPEEYDIPGPGRLGWRYDFGEGELFQAEPHAESNGQRFASLAWSTALDWNRTFEAIREILELVGGVAEVEFEDGSSGSAEYPAPSKLMVENAAKDERTATFVRIDADDHSIVWTSGGRDQAALFGVMIVGWDPSYLKLLVDRTATPHVRSGATTLIDRCSLIRRWLRQFEVETRLTRR